VSLIPGVVGMVYRRNFWGWFTPPFVILFLITSGLVGRQTEAGQLFIFLVSQILIILLALRLQRYTRKTGVLPPAVHNWLLAIVLVLIAVAGVYQYGEPFWNLFNTWYKWQFILIGLPVLYTLLRRSDVWGSVQPKNIVVCLDGTTNTPDQFESGRLAQTNVFKLFKMLKSDVREPGGLPERAFNASLSKRYNNKQVGLYYSGVGNKFEYDPIVQTLGGVTGLGAAGVVDKAYLDIIRVYRPGDRIFIAGFSRGAAIARLLSRALDQRGAPKTIWTWRLLGRHWTLWQSRRAQDTKVPVTVLGCFDTVGAFGIGKNIAGIDFQKLDLFKDLTVPDNVEQAYHMVALDETREEFSPTLMDPDPIAPARIVEVWFAGDHANIGGGWGTTKLSDLTFDFFLRKVSSGYAHTPGEEPGDERWGIYLNAANERVIAPERIAAADAFPLHPDPLGQLRLWKSAVYVYKPRELPSHAVISETVFERMTNAAPLYAPASLFDLHEALNEKRTHIDAAVKSLKDTQSVSEQEHDAILSFKDRLHLIRWPQYAAGLKAHGIPPPDEILKNTAAQPAAEAAAPDPVPSAPAADAGPSTGAPR
ncbi:MAG: phospholipase effector Tle1 domain-containing protein, partial [Hyphomicrobiaceae bacterium]